jgi:hypothetical protein
MQREEEEQGTKQGKSPAIEAETEKAMTIPIEGANDSQNEMMEVDNEQESSGSDIETNPLPNLRKSNSVLLKVSFSVFDCNNFMLHLLPQLQS